MTAPDAGRRTLHIRCGSDIEGALREAGFAGDFLEYSDPVCQGPVPNIADLPEIRARFLTEAYGGLLDRPDALTLKLDREAAGLAGAAAYERVVLWMEHDSYDQLILVRCLATFAGGAAPPCLELVSADDFPRGFDAGVRFIGIGQLPPQAMHPLWQQRRVLSNSALATGQAAWSALRAPDPSGLAAIHGGTELPHLRGAIGRHLQELPWTKDGLGLTERLVLKVLVGGDAAIGEVYRDLMLMHEPLPWLSDLMFLFIVRQMEKVRVPVFVTVAETADLPWPQQRLSLTEVGHALLAEEKDWLTLHPPERWVGGVRIAPGARSWRWDGMRGAPVFV